MFSSWASPSAAIYLIIKLFSNGLAETLKPESIIVSILRNYKTTLLFKVCSDFNDKKLFNSLALFIINFCYCMFIITRGESPQLANCSTYTISKILKLNGHPLYLHTHKRKEKL